MVGQDEMSWEEKGSLGEIDVLYYYLVSLPLRHTPFIFTNMKFFKRNLRYLGCSTCIYDLFPGVDPAILEMVACRMRASDGVTLKNCLGKRLHER